MLKQVSINSTKTSVKLSVALGALLLSLGAAGEESGDLANGEKMRIDARLVRAGVTGALILGTEQNQPHYAVEDSNLVIYTHKLPQGYNRLTVNVQYGTNEVSSLLVEIYVKPGATDGEQEVEATLDAVKTVGAPGGGGGTNKHLLQYDGGATIKENGVILTHADIYNMLMNTPDFVVLVYADHAYHPNLVTATQIVFTCSYASTNGDVVVERVTITNTNDVTKLTQHAVTKNSVGGVAIGIDTTASGYYSHAEGENTTASGYASHAEGENTTASGDYSHAEGENTTASGYYSHAEGENTTASGYASHAEGSGTVTYYDYQHAQGTYNNADDMDGEEGAFMHGCGIGNNNRKNAFAIADDGSIYVIGLGGYDGTNHTEAQSLQEIFGASIIQADTNTNVNGYQVPQLTPDQVAQAYNSVVAGKSATITDATGNFHLGVMQADNLSGDLTISVIYLNVMLVSYTIDGGSVDIQFKNL